MKTKRCEALEAGQLGHSAEESGSAACEQCNAPATMKFVKQGKSIRVCDVCAHEMMRSLIKGHRYALVALSSEPPMPARSGGQACPTNKD